VSSSRAGVRSGSRAAYLVASFTASRWPQIAPAEGMLACSRSPHIFRIYPPARSRSGRSRCHTGANCAWTCNQTAPNVTKARGA